MIRFKGIQVFMAAANNCVQSRQFWLYFGKFNTGFIGYQLIIRTVDNMDGAFYIFKPFIGRHGEFDQQGQRHKGEVSFGYFAQAIIWRIQNEHSWIVHGSQFGGKSGAQGSPVENNVFLVDIFLDLIIDNLQVPFYGLLGTPARTFAEPPIIHH